MAEYEFDHTDADDVPAPIRLERRISDRWQTTGGATAICVGGEQFGQMHQLRLADCSDDGVGAISDTVLEPGTIVTLGFQTPGSLSRQAVVLRCQPCGEGYRVGLQFALRQAA